MSSSDAKVPEVLPPEPSKKPFSRSRKGIALAIAGMADLIQVAFLPLFGEGFASPAEDVLDFATAAALLGVLGFHWRLAGAFAIELVPGAALFPSWTAAVLSLNLTEPSAEAVTKVPRLQAERG
ncbi:MAG: hypothetical protein JST54_35640 [Deltaproteobacteria bacterium]|nr:hypothetical protein [Deltaproteobacteria bacterium]